ncbi:hypothetical protein C882_1947 [Caenispirillum salinarum AK4]|uniref:Uncharacterized protein n=1 Tax=Caenispirillum salinarum AK4 TaxID=1238182 RepID=K9H8T7_9PROT|nr:hypothetical protein C882_1947 [Caenispirillum salinarum AK4]
MAFAHGDGPLCLVIGAERPPGDADNAKVVARQGRPAAAPSGA